MSHLVQHVSSSISTTKENGVLVPNKISELSLTDEGPVWNWQKINDTDKTSVKYTDQNIELCTSIALIVRMHTTRALTISARKNMAPHIVLIPRDQAKINIVCEVHSKANLYLLSSFKHNLKLVGDVSAHAELRLFDFGAFVSSTRDMSMNLLGKKAEFNYVGLDQLHESVHKNSELVIYHKECETKSTQLFRGIYAGSASGSFVGRVVIEKNAGASSAQQLYKTIIIGEKAGVRVLPELVIHNHDISASHGATIGELDKEALFYLCSRGLSLKDAKVLLIESIALEMLGTITHPILRHMLMRESAGASSLMLRVLPS